MNRDLKKLCQLAGIDEEIRVTTYKGNVRSDEVHPKSMKPYIDIEDSIKAQSMTKFNNLL